MRVDLSKDEAEVIRGALQCLHGGEELDRLADLFLPVERYVAVLRPKGVVSKATMTGSGPVCRECGGAIHWHGGHKVWLHDVAPIEGDHRADGGPLVPTCPRCGGQAFGYRNATEQYWEAGDVIPTGHDRPGGCVFHLSTGWDGVGEGDGDPGTFCDNYSGDGCGAAIDLPEGWEILWD